MTFWWATRTALVELQIPFAWSSLELFSAIQLLSNSFKFPQCLSFNTKMFTSSSSPNGVSYLLQCTLGRVEIILKLFVVVIIQMWLLICTLVSPKCPDVGANNNPNWIRFKESSFSSARTTEEQGKEAEDQKRNYNFNRKSIKGRRKGIRDIIS